MVCEREEGGIEMSQLHITSLSKHFDQQPVLQNLSLQVEEGEFVSILGPSGSGKTTLFHMIGGMMEPEEGSIVLDGEKINGKRGFISYMPQDHALLPWRTVLGNVILGQEIHGRKDEERAKEWIVRAGLSGYEGAYPDELSGGMKQRVAFIRALMSPQSLLCLDEPFSSLDEFTRLDMQKWLMDIWEEDKRSVLFITHNIDEALFLSDRIIVLSGKPSNVQKEFRVPYPRPRDEKMILSKEFLEHKKEIFQELTKHVQHD
jgi:ABC-type nitrate/sulfonate/bicarbonate transport system ATPase subunit